MTVERGELREREEEEGGGIAEKGERIWRVVRM